MIYTFIITRTLVSVLFLSYQLQTIYLLWIWSLLFLYPRPLYWPCYWQQPRPLLIFLLSYPHPFSFLFQWLWIPLLALAFASENILSYVSLIAASALALALSIVSLFSDHIFGLFIRLVSWSTFYNYTILFLFVDLLQILQRSKRPRKC